MMRWLIRQKPDGGSERPGPPAGGGAPIDAAVGSALGWLHAAPQKPVLLKPLQRAVDLAELGRPEVVDRAVERDVGRIVARDDAPRRLRGQYGAQRRWDLVEAAPPVVERFRAKPLEAAGRVTDRPATPARARR